MKRIFILSLFMVSACLAAAQPRRVDFGFEVGMNLQFYKYSHFRFIDSEGSRVDAHTAIWGTNFCPDLAIRAGTFVTKSDHLALYVGAAGIYDDVTVFPASVRYSHFYGAYGTDCWLSFADLGAWYDFERKSSVSPIAKVGGGYSVQLGRHSRLELLAALQTTVRHPELFVSTRVPQDKSLKNSDIPLGLVFSVNITL